MVMSEQQISISGKTNSSIVRLVPLEVNENKVQEADSTVSEAQGDVSSTDTIDDSWEIIQQRDPQGMLLSGHVTDSSSEQQWVWRQRMSWIITIYTNIVGPYIMNVTWS